MPPPSATAEPPDTLNALLACPLVGQALLRATAEKPESTQKQLATNVGKSEGPVKRMTVAQELVQI